MLKTRRLKTNNHNEKAETVVSRATIGSVVGLCVPAGAALLEAHRHPLGRCELRVFACHRPRLSLWSSWGPARISASGLTAAYILTRLIAERNCGGESRPSRKGGQPV